MAGRLRRRYWVGIDEIPKHNRKKRNVHMVADSYECLMRLSNILVVLELIDAKVRNRLSSRHEQPISGSRAANLGKRRRLQRRGLTEARWPDRCCRQTKT